MKITLYSRLNCQGCDTVARYLEAAKATFETIKAEVTMPTDEVKALFESETGQPLTSVPQVVVDGVLIGDLQAFMPWFRENKDRLEEATKPEDIGGFDIDL